MHCTVPACFFGATRRGRVSSARAPLEVSPALRDDGGYLPVVPRLAGNHPWCSHGGVSGSRRFGNCSRHGAGGPFHGRPGKFHLAATYPGVRFDLSDIVASCLFSSYAPQHGSWARGGNGSWSSAGDGRGPCVERTCTAPRLTLRRLRCAGGPLARFSERRWDRMDTTTSRSAPPSGVRFPPLRALMEVRHPSVLGGSERPVGKFDARARLGQGLGVRLGALATARNRTSEAPRSHKASL